MKDARSHTGSGVKVPPAPSDSLSGHTGHLWNVLRGHSTSKSGDSAPAWRGKGQNKQARQATASAANSPFSPVAPSRAQPTGGQTHAHVLREAGTSPAGRDLTLAVARPTRPAAAYVSNFQTQNESSPRRPVICFKKCSWMNVVYMPFHNCIAGPVTMFLLLRSFQHQENAEAQQNKR